jgi:hypothetical protein
VAEPGQHALRHPLQVHVASLKLRHCVRNRNHCNYYKIRGHPQING